MKKIIVIIFILMTTLSLRSENYPCDTDDCLDALNVKWDSLFVNVNVENFGYMKTLNPSGCNDCKFYLFYRIRHDVNNVCPNVSGCEIQISQVWMDGACFIPCVIGGVTYPPYYNTIDFVHIWSEAIRYFAVSGIEPCLIPPDPHFPGDEKITLGLKFGSCKSIIVNPDNSITYVNCDYQEETCCEQTIRTKYRLDDELEAGWVQSGIVYDDCDETQGCEFMCVDPDDWTPPIINEGKILLNGIDYKIKYNKIELTKAKFDYEVTVFDINGLKILNKKILQGDVEEIRIPDNKFPSIITFSEENGNILKLEKVIE